MGKKTINALIIFFIIILSCYTWRMMPNMTIASEGFTWLQNYQWVNFSRGFPHTLYGNEVLAIIWGKGLVNLFGLNMSLYFIAELTVMIIINILLYLLILIITKKRLVAFSSALFFGASYFGYFGIVAGLHSYYMERVVGLIFLIPSLIFLHLYLEKLYLKYYFVCVIIFTLGMGLSHWNIFFIGPFIFYPILWYLFPKPKLKQVVKGGAIAFLFLLISLHFMVNATEQRVSANSNLITFLLQPEKNHYPQLMIRQLTYWSQYPSIFKSFKPLKDFNTKSFFYMHEPMRDLITQEAINIQSHIAFLYALAFLIILIKLPKYRALILTVVLTGLSLLYLNIYLGVYQVEFQAGPNRYLILPSIPLAIFWSLFLWAVFWNHKKRSFSLTTIGLLIVFIYYAVNSWLITENFRWYFTNNNPTKLVFDNISSLAPKLKPETLIITPWDQADGYTVNFLNDQFKEKGIRFIPDNKNWLSPERSDKIASDSAHIITIKYDMKCKCVLEEKIK